MSATAEMVVAEPVAPDLTGQSLEDLAATANRTYAESTAALTSAIEGFFIVGKALLAAQAEVERCTSQGEAPPWPEWLAANFTGTGEDARRCMRLAYYEPQLREAGVADARTALTRLRGLPAVPRRGLFSPEVKERARYLVASGLPHREVAGLVNASQVTVAKWCDGEFAARRRTMLERRRQEEREERIQAAQRKRDREVGNIGGSVAESYSMIRKTAQAIDQAHRDATDSEIRGALAKATAQLHAAEDEIVKALGIA